jgi:hypothetical protein
MFDSLSDETLRADIATELENRGKPTVGDTPARAKGMSSCSGRQSCSARSPREEHRTIRMSTPSPGIMGWPASGLVRRPGGRSRAAPAGRCGYRP